MPTYTYTGDEGRYYPTLGLEPEPDSQHELERNPDPDRFTPPDAEPELAAGTDPQAPEPVRRRAAKKES